MSNMWSSNRRSHARATSREPRKLILSQDQAAARKLLLERRRQPSLSPLALSAVAELGDEPPVAQLAPFVVVDRPRPHKRRHTPGHSLGVLPLRVLASHSNPFRRDAEQVHRRPSGRSGHGVHAEPARCGTATAGAAAAGPAAAWRARTAVRSTCNCCRTGPWPGTISPTSPTWPMASAATAEGRCSGRCWRAPATRPTTSLSAPAHWSWPPRELCSRSRPPTTAPSTPDIEALIRE